MHIAHLASQAFAVAGIGSDLKRIPQFLVALLELFQASLCNCGVVANLKVTLYLDGYQNQQMQRSKRKN